MEPQAQDSGKGAEQSAGAETWQEKAWALIQAGHSAYKASQMLGMPSGTVSTYITRRKRIEVARSQGIQQGAQTAGQAQGQQSRMNAPPRAQPSPEERSRIAALRLLAKVSREGLLGNRSFASPEERDRATLQMKERVDAAKAIIAKVKAPSAEDEADKATVYASMGDEELADHVVTAACASLGLARVREVLDRLEREALLIKAPAEHAAVVAASGLG